MQNLVNEWVDFSKFFTDFSKIGSNLRKFRKNQAILLKIRPKIGPLGIWMGHFFLKNWYLYGTTIKFCSGTSLPKPNSGWRTSSATQPFNNKKDEEERQKEEKKKKKWVVFFVNVPSWLNVRHRYRARVRLQTQCAHSLLTGWCRTSWRN